MKYRDFVQGLCIIRENNLRRKIIHQQLVRLDTEPFDLTKVTDYEYQIRGTNCTPDGKVINAIYNKEQRRSKLLSSLERLPSEDDRLIKAINDIQGTEGEILRSYYLDGERVETLLKSKKICSKSFYNIIDNAMLEYYYSFLSD